MQKEVILVEWEQEVVNESDFPYTVYTCEIRNKRAEIRCLDGGTGNRKYGADILLERLVSKKLKRWEAVVDREWCGSCDEARKIAEEWLNK